MKEIKLTQDQIAIVDDEDFERVNQFKWCAHWSPIIKSFYAIRGIRNKKTKKVESIKMHRFIMGLEKGDRRQIDHINKNTLDNRKENLKICTCRENNENRKDQSEYGVGIRLMKDKNLVKPYQLQIRINGIKKHIGYFTKKEVLSGKVEKIRIEYLKNLNNTGVNNE